MGVGPPAPTFGTGLKRLLHSDITLTPAYSTGQIASGFLLPCSPAVGTFNGRRLDRNLSAAATNRAPGTPWPLPFALAEGTIKFVALIGDLYQRGRLIYPSLGPRRPFPFHGLSPLLIIYSHCLYRFFWGS